MDNPEFDRAKIISMTFAYITGKPSAGLHLVAYSQKLTEALSKLLLKRVQLPLDYDNYFMSCERVLWRYIPIGEFRGGVFAEYIYSGRDNNYRHIYDIALVGLPHFYSSVSAEKIAALLSKTADNIILEKEEFKGKSRLINIEGLSFDLPEIVERYVEPTEGCYLLSYNSEKDNIDSKRYSFIQFIIKNATYQRYECVLGHNVQIEALKRSFKDAKIAPLIEDELDMNSFIGIKKAINILRTKIQSGGGNKDNDTTIKEFSRLFSEIEVQLKQAWKNFGEFKNGNLRYDFICHIIPAFSIENISFVLLCLRQIHSELISKAKNENDASQFNAYFHEFTGIVITEAFIKPRPDKAKA